MSWYTDGITGIITDGDRVVGSVHGGPKIGGGEVWRVEVMWSGSGGDIVCVTDNFEKALCFIEGVEKTVAAFTKVVTLKVQP